MVNDESCPSHVSEERIATGFRDVDHLLRGGIRRGSLTVIAGYGGSGSTSLALQIACRAATVQSMEVGYLTLDHKPEELIRRAVCAEQGFRHLWSEEREAAVRRLFDERLFVRSTSRNRRDVLFEVVVGDRSKDLVVVDTLNFVDVVDEDMSFPDPPPLDSIEIDGFMRHLKVQARDRDRAVIVTASLAPPAADPCDCPGSVELRSLGPAASIADQVLVLRRPDRWDRETPRAGEADIMVRGWTVTVAHQLHRYRFVDLVRGRTASQGDDAREFDGRD